LRALFLALTVAWLVAQPLIRAIFDLPWIAGQAVTLLGIAVIAVIALTVIKRILAPLVEVRDELAAESRGHVYGIELDPVWMPVGNKSPKPDGLGFLVVNSDRIRIVSGTKEVIVDALWDELAEARSNRAPKPIMELELHRGGAATHWWFHILDDSLMARRGARGIDDLVKTIKAVRPPSLA